MRTVCPNATDNNKHQYAAVQSIASHYLMLCIFCCVPDNDKFKNKTSVDLKFLEKPNKTWTLSSNISIPLFLTISDDRSPLVHHQLSVNPQRNVYERFMAQTIRWRTLEYGRWWTPWTTCTLRTEENTESNNQIVQKHRRFSVWMITEAVNIDKATRRDRSFYQDVPRFS